MTTPLDILASLRIEDGRTWGDAAVPVQLADARAILDPGGPPYSYLTRARGGSKTSDLGGINSADLLTGPPNRVIDWIAADFEQGQLVLDAISGFCQRTDLLRGALDVQASRVVCRSTGSRLDVLTADGPSNWGRRPARVNADELANWPETLSARAVWEAASTSVTKVPGAGLVVITTAGSPRHFSYKVLEHARSSPLWRVSETPGPPPWIDPERLAEQLARLPEPVGRQLFYNEWIEPAGTLLSPDALDACFDLAGPAIRRDRRWRYFAGLDLGHVRDRTVFAIVHREADGVHLDRMLVWSGTRAAPVSFSSVERAIVRADDEFGFRLSMDPWQGYHLAERLRRRGVRAEEVAFSSGFKAKLASTLLAAVSDRALHLYPDPELRDELAGLHLVQRPGGWTFDHATGAHDDRAMALSLAMVAALDSPIPSKNPPRVRSGGYTRDALGRPVETVIGHLNRRR